MRPDSPGSVGGAPPQRPQTSVSLAGSQRRQMQRDMVLAGAEKQRPIRFPAVTPLPGVGQTPTQQQQRPNTVHFPKNWAKTPKRPPTPMDNMRKISVNNIAVLQWLKKHRKRIPDRITDEQRENYKRIFNMIDTDKSGGLDVNEICEAQKTVGISMNYTQLLELMQQMDPTVGKKSSLNFQEFCHTFCNNNEWDALLPLAKRYNEQKAVLTRHSIHRSSPKRSMRRSSSVGLVKGLTSPTTLEPLPNAPSPTTSPSNAARHKTKLPKRTRRTKLSVRSSDVRTRKTSTSSAASNGLRNLNVEKFVTETQRAPLMPFHLWVPTYHRRQTLKGIVENGCAYLDNGDVQLKLQKVMGVKREKWDKPSRRKYQGFKLKDAPQWKNQLHMQSVLLGQGYINPREIPEDSITQRKGCPGTPYSPKRSPKRNPKHSPKRSTKRAKSLTSRKIQTPLAQMPSPLEEKPPQVEPPKDRIKLRALPQTVYMESRPGSGKIVAPRDLQLANHKAPGQKRNKFAARLEKKNGLSSEWQFIVSKMDAAYRRPDTAASKKKENGGRNGDQEETKNEAAGAAAASRASASASASPKHDKSAESEKERNIAINGMDFHVPNEGELAEAFAELQIDPNTLDQCSREIFNEFDKAKKGTICSVELKSVINAVAAALKLSFTCQESSVRQMLDHFDQGMRLGAHVVRVCM